MDDSASPGVGLRLDGLANRDLNIGAIAAAAPNLQPVADILGVSVATVRQVLNSWGPGKFDAQLLLDGKAFNPSQLFHGVVTGQNVSGATMIPNALGLAGYNQHTWTGSWGSVSYWNAFVANLEMHGKGTFFDPRLDDPVQFPIAAKIVSAISERRPMKTGLRQSSPLINLSASPSRLDTNTRHRLLPQAAQRGAELFIGKARCNDCHVKPLWMSRDGTARTRGDRLEAPSRTVRRTGPTRHRTSRLSSSARTGDS